MIEIERPLDDWPYDDFFNRYNFNSDLMGEFEEK